MGNPERSLYSLRFPTPIFYLVEMTWPYVDVHPISLLLYIVGLAGLGMFVWRRKREDKFVLVWFICVFVFFTLISNREWRYVLTLFPALAISASVLILFAYDKLHGTWMHSVRVNRKKTAKVAAGLLIVFLSIAVAYSVNDIYYNVKQTDINIEIAQATNYALAGDASNQSIMLLCPFNYFSQDMVSFYLTASGNSQIKTYQYPTSGCRHLHTHLQHHRIHRPMQTRQRKIRIHLRIRRYRSLLQHHTEPRTNLHTTL